MSARVTVIGNVATVPTSRRVGDEGRPVTNFRVASTDRRLDRTTGQWVDFRQFFIGVACWGQLAENVASSVKLGTPVVVHGAISQRSWTDRDDKPQITYEINADTVAPDLSKGTAVFSRVNRHSGPSIALDDHGDPALVTFDTPADPVDEHPSASLVSGPFGDDVDLRGGRPDRPDGAGSEATTPALAATA